MVAASSYSAARRARALRTKLTDAGAPKVFPSVQTAAITLIWLGRGLKANSESGCEMLAPGSMVGRLSNIVSQTFLVFLAGCVEEALSKTRAPTGLPLRFVTVQEGPLSPRGWDLNAKFGLFGRSLWIKR